MTKDNSAASDTTPFVVDLDGTLVLTDLLWEAVVLFIRAHPRELWRLPLWLLAGKTVLKEKLAERVAIQADRLPYNQALLANLQTLKQQGRPLVLATGSHHRFAQAVADHLNLFDEVMATSGRLNLTAVHKAQALTTRFGVKGYDYIGNDVQDIPVWQTARQSWSVNAKGYELGGGVAPQPMAVVPGQSAAVLLKALRPRQWLKNLLVFVPLLAAHTATFPSFGQAFGAFIGFCLCASSAYLVNDTLDAQEDRMHRFKKSRPIAAGALPIPAALSVAAVFAGLAFLLGAYLGTGLMLVLVVYYALTTTYSIWLKRLLLLDVVALAMLYILRVVGGGVATGIVLSFWLLAFLLFMLLSLALLKRHSELHHLQSVGATNSNGRGYFVSDAVAVAAMGIASGFLGMMVFMLYVNSPAVMALYSQPVVLMAIVPLLVYWHGRIWIQSFRGVIHEDPVFFISKDHVSALVFSMALVIAFVATVV